MLVKKMTREVFQTLHTNRMNGSLNDMARTKSAAKSAVNPRTVQRTYRFDAKVFQAFEDDCAQHLSNPKRVIEALIIYWLEADSDARAAMAKKHRERIAYGYQDE